MYQLRAVACVTPESEFLNVRLLLSTLTPARYTSTLRAVEWPRPAKITMIIRMTATPAMIRLSKLIGNDRLP